MLKKIFTNVSDVLASSGEGDHESGVEKRGSRFYFVLGLIFILFMAVMFYRSGVIEGWNKNADNLKAWAEAEGDADTIVAGDAYDRNGTLLVKHEKVNEPGVYIEDTLYSPLIGYIDDRVIVYSGGEAVDETKASRLLKYYSTDQEYLFKNADIDGRKGSDLILTLDHELQAEVDRLLTEEMGTKARGSAIVMDAKTGELLAVVSHPSYNANDLENSIIEMNNAPKEDEVFYPITHKGAVVTGSIFKLITGIALVDNGLEDMKVVDNDFTIDGVPINNSYGSTGETIDYHTAISKSSNVFFAQAALALGKDKMDEAAEKFKIGENLELDFGTIKSNWGTMTDKNGNLDRAKLAQTGFGQGDTLFSTMYAAMMTQAIANDGVMVEPYLIHEIRDAKGNTLKTGETKVLSEATCKETADKITAAMVSATESHLHVVEGAENRAVYETYKIASKTGTGETGNEEEPNQAWLVSFAPYDDPQYVVVANQCKTEKYGQDLMDTVAGIYQYLFEKQ